MKQHIQLSLGDQPQKIMSLRHGVKQMLFSSDETLAILMTNDSIQIVDCINTYIYKSIKNLTLPRFIQLARSGTFFLVYYSDNTVRIYDTKYGQQISTLVGIPRSSNTFILSYNDKKVLYGNNQTICLWNIPTCTIQLLTQQWHNINCYALNNEGSQFALGTYNGNIYVLSIIGLHRCRQLQMKCHKTCIMCLTYHDDKIVSISYDKLMVITTIQSANNGEKIITYEQKYIIEIPKEIISADNIYLSYIWGIQWYSYGQVFGIDEGKYAIIKRSNKNENQNQNKYFRNQIVFYNGGQFVSLSQTN